MTSERFKLEYLRIFGKYGTDEKILISCTVSEVPRMLEKLSLWKGGEWVWVSTFNPLKEALPYTDGKIIASMDDCKLEKIPIKKNDYGAICFE